MLINTYKLDEDKPMGFGDFIRGCISCHQISLEYNFEFEIDLGPFSEFYKETKKYFPKNNVPITNFRNLTTNGKSFAKKLYFHSGKDFNNFNISAFSIFTNVWPQNTIDTIEKPNLKHTHKGWGDISKTTKKFIKDRLKPNIKKNDFLKSLPIEYEVVHIRTGDPNAFKNSFDAKVDVTTSENGIASYMMFQLVDILKTTDKPLIILSDSLVVKNYINTISSGFNSDRIIVSDVEAKHAGTGGCEETFNDLCILNKSKKIHQFSVYPWGSGFSNIAHHIYDVPIERYDKLKSHF